MRSDRGLARAHAAAHAALLVGALSAGALGCGSAAPDAAGDGPGRPDQPCSELARIVLRYEGREQSRCGSAPLEFRDIVPIGPDRFIAWTPSSGAGELWSRSGDRAASPHVSIYWGDLRNNKLLVGLSEDRALAYDQLSGAWFLYRVDVAARIQRDFLTPQIAKGTWPRLFAGRDLQRLDEQHLLEWVPGSGRFQIWRVDLSKETTAHFVPTAFGGRRDAFRRGHQLVPLGMGRLLEWVPARGEYRIWPFSFGGGRGDPFAAAPVASGTWPQIGRGHELRAAAPGRLLVWERATGIVEEWAFDPASPDPLAGRPVRTTQSDRLRSLPRAFEKETASPIRRLVFVVQQGRSFDLYYGRYCQAPPGSAPSCTDGPGCCEAMPATTPGAERCEPWDGAVDDHRPNDADACLLAKINGGAMDGFARSPIPGCGHPRDFACAEPGERAGAVAAYHELAREGALADRYFQSAVLPAFSIITYLTNGRHNTSLVLESGPHITSELAELKVPWALYLGNPEITFGWPPPQFYDGRWSHFRHVGELLHDVALEQLAPVSIVLAPDALGEAPGAGPAAAGIAFAASVARAIASSPRYEPETLVLVAHLTSGGFYDHVAPPPPPPAAFDPAGHPYGPRVPLLALGRFARRNHVSHEPLEISSVMKFIEWNWLGRTGLFGARDAYVNNLGSLLDPAAKVPEQDGVPRPPPAPSGSNVAPP